MNITSTSSSSSRRLTGLASGIDTDSMVEQMLSGIQKKIDTQNSLKQQVTWKQEIYRSIISDLNAFQSRFFQVSNAGFLSNSFYNTMSAVTGSSAVKITASSSAPVGKSTLKVEQLATSSSVKSGREVSGTLSGELDASALTDRRVYLNVGSEEIMVDLAGADTTEAIATKLRDALGSKAAVTVSGDSLTFTGSNPVRVSAKSSKLGLAMLGSYGGATANFSQSELTYKLTSTADPQAKATVDVQLDDVKKTVTLEGATAAEMRANLQTSLDKAFGTGAIQVGGGGNGLTMETSIKGRQITVSGSEAGLAALGMASGQSSKITTESRLGDLNFGTKLMGGRYTFEINGESFTFSENDTLATVMSRVNNSGADVRLTYMPGADGFTIESKSSGAGFDIDMKDTEGNLLTAMFGQITKMDGSATGAAAPKATSRALTLATLTGGSVDSDATIGSGSFVIKVDGRDYTLNLPAKANGGSYTQSSAVESLNNALANLFGYRGGEQNISLEMDGGSIVVKTAGSQVVEFAAADGSSTDVAAFLGLDGKSNLATADTLLSDLGITDSPFTTLGELGTVEDGRVLFGAIADASGLSNEAKMKLFGTADLGEFAPDPTGPKMQANMGQNAKFTFNGLETERSTNNFTIDGLNIELLAAPKNAAGEFEDIEIDVTRNTDHVVDTIKSFVEEYNKIITRLNKLVGEKAVYKDYPPLTSAQKKELSQSEIELWEEKAKEGLIRRDSTITSLLSNMRTALYSTPAGSGLSLYDLGIETSSDWRDQGKLVIADEAALRNMVSASPEDFQKLFSGADGIMAQVNRHIDAAAKTSSATPGALVELAGYAGRATATENTLSKQLASIQDKIKTLTDTYSRQQQRYWNQFTAMEKAISSMSTQSSWLMQQFGGY